MSGKKKLTQSEFMSLVKEKHGHRDYDWTNTLYVNRSTMVKVICPNHGEFSSFPKELLSGKCCQKCSPRKKYKLGIRKGQGKEKQQTREHIDARFANMVWKKGHIAHNRLTNESFISQLISHWPDCPYDLSKVEYITTDIKITLICHTHGDFLKWPSDVKNKSGCPKCAGLVYDSNDVISKLSRMFPNYDYSDSDYVKSTKQMKVRCKIHDSIFYQSHYRKEECPECSKERRLRDRIAAGRAKDPMTLTEYEKYKKAVWKETTKSYKQHKETLGERNRFNHLDHIYSILQGFRDDIDPIILGSIVNLRILDSKLNQSKNTRSDYSKEKLMELYEETKK
jgi:hypothetical protein